MTKQNKDPRQQKMTENLRLGALAYRLYYRPLGCLREMHKKGYWSYFRMELGAACMRRGSVKLLPLEAALSPASSKETPITFLTGNDYWWQTIWCAQTLLHHAQRPLHFEFIDDGSLKSNQCQELKRLFPHATLVEANEVERQIEKTMPPDKAPEIWHYRRIKPIFRKLTDVFGRDQKWRLLLDSDMLFFAKPTQILDWLECPRSPIYMLDIHDAYGYSSSLTSRLAGGPLPSKVNIGIFGFSGERVDWKKTERWIETLTAEEGLKYNLTQALSAMLLVESSAIALPAEDYLLLPTEEQARSPTQPLQHYVAESKDCYFRHAWRSAAAQLING